MFRLFPKSNSKENISTEKEFITVNSFYGTADHIALNDKPAKPLCGYEGGIVTDFTYNKDRIVKSIPNQHRGFFWCTDCANIATGISVQEISAWRETD